MYYYRYTYSLGAHLPNGADMSVSSFNALLTNQELLSYDHNDAVLLLDLGDYAELETWTTLSVMTCIHGFIPIR